MPGGEVADPPYSLKAAEECSLDKVVNLSALNPLFYLIKFYVLYLINLALLEVFKYTLRIT